MIFKKSHAQTHSLYRQRNVSLFRPYLHCLWIVPDDLYGFATQKLIRKQVLIVAGVKMRSIRGEGSFEFKVIVES